MDRLGFTPPRPPGAPPHLVRRLRAPCASTRFRLERAAAGRVSRAAPPLTPVHLSLRDSRTLNLALAAGSTGPSDRARLLITRGRRRLAVPLAYERHTAAVPLLTATATLRDMRDGVWRLTVETRAPTPRTASGARARRGRRAARDTHRAMRPRPADRNPRTDRPVPHRAGRAPGHAVPGARGAGALRAARGRDHRARAADRGGGRAGARGGRAAQGQGRRTRRRHRAAAARSRCRCRSAR